MWRVQGVVLPVRFVPSGLSRACSGMGLYVMMGCQEGAGATMEMDANAERKIGMGMRMDVAMNMMMASMEMVISMGTAVHMAKEMAMSMGMEMGMDLDMDSDVETEPAFEIVTLDYGIVLCMLSCVVRARGECMRVYCGAWYVCVVCIWPCA